MGRQGSGRARTLSASGSRLELDDSWITASPAFMELQDRSVAVKTTVNHEYFVVKIFSDNLAYAKIKHVKIYAHY